MRRVWIAGSAAIAVAGIFGLWWLALPRHEVCVMTHPAPAGCGDHRVLPALIWTVLLLTVTIGGGVAAAKLKRFWLAPMLLVGVSTLALVAFAVVRQA